MVKIKKIIVVAISLVAVTTSWGGTAGPTRIHAINFMPNGVAIFYVDNGRVSVPSCAANQPSRFALNGATSGGKVQLSGLLTAYAAGRQIYVHGTGDCGYWGDTESVDFFYTSGD